MNYTNQKFDCIAKIRIIVVRSIQGAITSFWGHFQPFFIHFHLIFVENRQKNRFIREDFTGNLLWVIVNIVYLIFHPKIKILIRRRCSYKTIYILSIFFSYTHLLVSHLYLDSRASSEKWCLVLAEISSQDSANHEIHCCSLIFFNRSSNFECSFSKIKYV